MTKTPQCDQLEQHLNTGVPPALKNEMAIDMWRDLAHELEKKLCEEKQRYAQLKLEVAAAVEWSWDMEEIEIALKKLGISSEILHGSKKKGYDE